MYVILRKHDDDNNNNGLKLFAKTEEEIKSLLNSISLFSCDIGT